MVYNSMKEKFSNRISKLQIWSRTDNTLRDVSSSASDITWKTDLTTATELTFNFVKSKNSFTPNNGDQVSFAWNGDQVFTGWIFKTKLTNDEKWEITAYANSRYLKGTGTYVWQASSSAERFERIMKDLRLEYSIDDRSSYRVADEVTDGATYFDMINSVIKETLHSTQQRFFLIDDPFGKIKHVSMENMQTDLMIGDGANLSTWSYDKSIEDMSNIIQVIHEDSNTKEREIKTAQDEQSINNFGPLVHAETVSGDVNSAQLQDKANSLLREKNGETRTLSLKSLGDVRVRAGTSLSLSISDLFDSGIKQNQRILVKSCTHNFGVDWTMDMEVTLL
ncbi:hypothetical protein R4B61_00320 [Fructilactobacillus vespulae]|uniref:XkdQ/YqbQ family protein n=1 Tax=Fructilactobacillus vespulae TaxID=1249630 RepID=UPI0039B5167F